jgi:small-conductance mechanosensitive channel
MLKVSNSILLIFFILRIGLGQQADQTDQKKIAEENKSTPEAIAVTKITEQADLTHQKLQDLFKEIEPSKDLNTVENEIPQMLDSLQKRQSNKIFGELENQELRVLTALRQEWNLYQSKLNEWKDKLLSESENVEERLQVIKELLIVWQLTREQAQKAKAPRAIQNRVSSTIKEINESEKKVSKRLNDLLLKQNTISKSQKAINELLSQIKTTEENKEGQLFVRDSPPIWELVGSEQDTLQITGQFRESWSELFRANLAFIQVNQNRFYLHLSVLILLLILMLFFNRLNKREQLIDKEDVALKHSAHFVSRPISAALLIALFLSIWIYPEYPRSVGEFLMLLLLIPVLRLVGGILIKEVHRPVYIMAVIFVFDIIQKNALGFVLMQRTILLLGTITALGIIIWLIRPDSPIRRKGFNAGARLVFRSSYLAILFLIVSLAANVYGSVALAGTLTWGVVESSHLLVTIYITVKVSTGLVNVLIRRRRRRAMQFIKTYAFSLERWTNFAISFIGFYIWIRATLNVLGLFEALSSWFIEVRKLSWMVGNVVISIDAIVDFIIVLIVTFILIRVIRIFLDMEIFPRLKLPKGLPSAINMMVRYTLVTMGIFLALSSIGIDLGKFGLLAGALGVGLGFGLQKIVANFISSLIIAFGRSIRVGDTVQYQEVLGNVKEIGVNASIVRTFDGSDVIIPNADLISNNVTNWTLLDTQRRMLLPVKVAFGHDPHEVLKILEKVARDHDDVLNNPAPFAVFNGFGDNYLDFSLYYWIPTSLFFKVKTEIALAVHDAITVKGIQTPRPQRDLRVQIDENIDKRKLPGITKSAKRSNLTKKKDGKQTT